MNISRSDIPTSRRVFRRLALRRRKRKAEFKGRKIGLLRVGIAEIEERKEGAEAASERKKECEKGRDRGRGGEELA